MRGTGHQCSASGPETGRRFAQSNSPVPMWLRRIHGLLKLDFARAVVAFVSYETTGYGGTAQARAKTISRKIDETSGRR